jgi:hypothetical protein
MARKEFGGRYRESRKGRDIFTKPTSEFRKFSADKPENVPDLLENRPLPFALTANETTLILADDIHSKPPEWDTLFSHLDEMNFKGNHESTVGLVGEVHVNNVVNEFAERGDVKEIVVLNPIEPGLIKGDFHFKRNKSGNMVAVEASTKHPVAEYDFFLEAEGLPVVGEVRIAGHRFQGNRGEQGWAHLVTPKTIEKKLKPIRKHYANADDPEQYGYVIVTVPDVILPAYHTGMYEGQHAPLENSLEEIFIQRGGVLVSLPFDLEEVNDEVSRYRRTAPGMRGSTSELTDNRIRELLLAKFPPKRNK